jgi:hypothetical protein
MSARANASAKAKRANGAIMDNNNNNNNRFDNNSVNSSCSLNQNKQPISVKQAIILLNTKVNGLSQIIANNNDGRLSNNNNIEIGTLEMRSSELQKKNDLLSNELILLKKTIKDDLDSYKISLNDVKDMVLKLQSSVTDLQGTVLKLNKN